MNECRARIILLALFLLVAASGLRAQDTVRLPLPSDTTASVTPSSTPSTVSTATASPTASAPVAASPRVRRVQGTPSIKNTSKNTTVKKEHSATKALLWSLLPGAGQVYNHQAWKIPIIYTCFAGAGYFIYTNGTNMAKFKKEYLYRVNNDGATQLAGYANYPTSNIYNLYQSYNQYFQLSIIVGAVFYGLNLIDAYVFGHLFDYDISDDISLRASPTMLTVPDYPLPSAPGLSLTLTF